jgi:hypothetical protein
MPYLMALRTLQFLRFEVRQGGVSLFAAGLAREAIKPFALANAFFSVM